MAEKDVIKEFEEYFAYQNKILKKLGFPYFEKFVQSYKNLLKRSTYNLNECIKKKNIINNLKKEIKEMKFIKINKISNKEKNKLFKKYKIKLIQKGTYGEGFFDGLKLGDKSEH